MKSQSEEYIAKEEGQERQPAELYHFWRGTTHWRYTSGDVAIVYDGLSYEPAELERSQVVYDEKLEVNTMSITVARVRQPAMEFIALAPTELIWISVHKIHRDLETEETSAVFIGQVKDVSFQGTNAKVNCVGFEHFLKQIVPRYRYGPGCQHTLYDEFCKVVQATYTISATISYVSSDGLTLRASEIGAQVATYFTLGYVTFGTYSRMITNHYSGGNIIIRYPIPYIDVGSSVSVSAGCTKTRAVCITKFNNLNYNLSFPDIPIDNPALWT